jgi:hypothetical protein
MASIKRIQSMNTWILDAQRCPHVFNSCRHDNKKQEKCRHNNDINWLLWTTNIAMFFNAWNNKIKPSNILYILFKAHFLSLCILSSICLDLFFFFKKKNPMNLDLLPEDFVLTHDIICFSSWCSLCFPCFHDIG